MAAATRSRDTKMRSDVDQRMVPGSCSNPASLILTDIIGISRLEADRT
jgi:hypothetical protein